MNPRLAYIGILLLSLVGYVGMGYFIERSDFVSLITCFSGLFLLYFLFLRGRCSWTWKQLFWIAMILRFSQLFVMPPLSDDYHRFLFDGQMIVQGENPYLILPQDYQPVEDSDYLEELVKQMNSPSYFTIYPPVSQFVFATAAKLSGGNILWGVVVLRLILLLFEGILLWLLPKILEKLGLPAQQMAWYALNPLVILEVAGNLHFEAMVLTFLALAFWFFRSKGVVLAAVCMALAISTKLLPVILFPLLWKPLGRQRWKFYLLSALFTLILFLPFMSMELWNHWSQSLDLFFRSFEFNASVYYLLREAGSFWYGYNPIQMLGPFLSLVALVLVLTISWNKKVAPLNKPVWVYAIFLFCATTVHPWYVVTLCGLGVVSNQRWMYVWSALIPLSYAHYIGGGFAENYVLIAVEYTLLLLFILLERRGSVRHWFSRDLT
jgi:alpha-1,6-mannosyltransferase